MSDELLNLEGQLLKNEDLDVEGHVKKSVTDEPTEATDEDEVEAHVRKALPRKI
jgi:hypothetical protein